MADPNPHLEALRSLLEDSDSPPKAPEAPSEDTGAPAPTRTPRFGRKGSGRLSRPATPINAPAPSSLVDGGRVTSDFGPRVAPTEGASTNHKGIDIGAKAGTPIKPYRPGVVVSTGVVGGYGNLVTVDHGDGLVTRYAHMSEILVEEGQEVNDGTTLGKVGETGIATGPHLHFEVRRNGKVLNPATFLNMENPGIVPRSSLTRKFRKDKARGDLRRFQIDAREKAMDELLVSPRAAADPKFSIPEDVPQPLTRPGGTPLPATDFDEGMAKQLGLFRLAEEVLDFKATVFGAEGEQPAGNLVLRAGQRSFGRFGALDPNLVEEELTYTNIDAMMVQQGITNFFDPAQVSQDQRESMIRVAKNMARDTVAGIMGTSESRGNIVVDTNPELTIEHIRKGKTALGYLTLVGIGSEVLDAVDDWTEGTPINSWVDTTEAVYDTIIRRPLAPFYAMMVSGGKSVQAQADTPVIGVEKESLLSWFFRAGLWSVVGSVAFDGEQETSTEIEVFKPFERVIRHWGSDRHVERLYAEGYDIVSEMEPLGRNMAKLTPWNEPEWVEQLMGFGGIMALVLFEPDLTALTLGAGKLLKVPTKGAKVGSTVWSGLEPGNLMVSRVFRPWMEQAVKRLEDGEDLKVILDEVPVGSPRESLKNALNVAFASKLLEEGFQFSRTNIEDVPFSIEKALENMRDTIAANQRRIQKRNQDFRARSRQAEDLSAGLDVRIAMDAAESWLMRSAMETLTLEAKLANDLKMVANKRGMTLDQLVKWGEESAVPEHLESLRNAFTAAQKRYSNAKKFGTRAEVDEARRIISDVKAQFSRVTERLADHRLVQNYQNVRNARRGQLAEIEDFYRAGLDAIDPGDVRAMTGGRVNRTYDQMLQGLEGQQLPKSLQKLTRRTLPAVLRTLATGTEDFNKLAGDYGEILQAFRGELAKSEKALAGMRQEGKIAQEEFDYATKAAEAASEEVSKLSKAISNLESGVASARPAGEVYAEILRENIGLVDEFLGRVRTGRPLVDEPSLTFQSSVIGSMVKSVDDVPASLGRNLRSADGGAATKAADDAIDGIEFHKKWVDELYAKYGASLRDAMETNPRIMEAISFVGAEKSAKGWVNEFYEVEKLIAAQGKIGVGPLETLRMALDDVIERPLINPRLSFETFLAKGMTAGRWIAQITDPILARGMANAPRAMREVFRRASETYSTAQIHAARIVRNDSPAALRDFLTTKRRFTVGDSLVSFNQGALTPHQKWFQHLKSVSRAATAAGGQRGLDLWTDDLAVKAIAHAWAPPGRAAAASASSSIGAFRKMVDQATSADELFSLILDGKGGKLRGIFARDYLRTDNLNVARRFMYQGIIWGAVQHDANRALLKAGGTNMSPEAGRALNFFTGALKAPEAGAVTAAGARSARELMETYRLPLTEAVVTGVQKPGPGGVARVMSTLTDTANDLVRVADVGDEAVIVPKYVHEAINMIPNGLAKELRQYNAGSPILRRSFDSWLSLWKHSVVNGWFFPRIAHYGTTYLGDLAQMIGILGFRDAVRITAQNTLVSIPFVGQRINNLIAGGRSGRLASAISNPMVNRLMQGDETLEFVTSDGIRTASQILEEGRSVGALDSISSGELAQLMGRTEKSTRLEDFGITGPSWLVRQSSEYMESVQHRIRMQIFAEARVAGMSVADAGQRMRDVMLDWRLGVTPWERNTIGRIAAFWTYRRQSLQQMGTILTDAFTNASAAPLWRVATGNTPLGRVRKMGALLNSVPEAVYWTDPEQTLTDEQQVEEWGKRQSPWYRTVEPILMGYRMSPEKELWYSEVTGKSVTYEQLALPGLTTLDALYQYSLLANLGIVSGLYALEEAGIETGRTTDEWTRLWEQGVNSFSDEAYPGLDQIIRGALGGTSITSRRGVGVPRNQALLLNRLGWGDFVQTYTDKDGRLRYVADPTAMTIVGRIIMQLPPIENVLQTYAVFDNPGYSESLATGVLETTARLSGLVRIAQFDPIQRREWEIKNQDREFKEALRSAEARANQR